MTRCSARSPKSFLLGITLALWSSVSFGYRPFEGTDAAVADPGELEIEVGPMQYLREGSERILIAPEATINCGFAKNWEAVWEGRVTRELSEPRQRSFNGHGAFLKGVLREGSLQDQTGPSVATEFGLLLPGIHGEAGTGASVAAIVSQQFLTATVHLNTAAALTREHRADFFAGAIVEGPHALAVRPVAEVFHEHASGVAHTTSALIGAIWRAGDRLAVDVGLRDAKTADQRVHEVRAGLTYSLPAR